MSTPVSIEEELNEKPEAPGEENTQKDNKIESDKTEVDKSKTVEVRQLLEDKFHKMNGHTLFDKIISLCVGFICHPYFSN